MVLRGTEALEVWSKRVTSGYPGVRIVNMTSSFKDGLAFCAIIHRFRPDLIDYNSLDPRNILENCKLAFETGEKELGIPSLLDPVDMATCSSPDRRSVLLYLSQMYQAFGHSSPQPCPRTSVPDRSDIHDTVPEKISRRKNSTDSGIDTNLSTSVDSALSLFSVGSSESDSSVQQSPPKPNRTFQHGRANLVKSVSSEPTTNSPINKVTNNKINQSGSSINKVTNNRVVAQQDNYINNTTVPRNNVNNVLRTNFISEKVLCPPEPLEVIRTEPAGDTMDGGTSLPQCMVKAKGESYTTEQVLKRDKTEKRCREVESMSAGSSFHAALSIFTSLEREKKPVEQGTADGAGRRLESKTTQTEESHLSAVVPAGAGESEEHGETRTPGGTRTLIPLESRPMDPVNENKFVPEENKTIVTRKNKTVDPRDIRTSVPVDSRIIVPRDVRTIVPGDIRTIVPGDIRPMVPGHIRTMVPGDVRAIVPGDIRPLVHGDVKNMVPEDIRTMVPGDIRTRVPGEGPTVVPLECKSKYNVDVPSKDYRATGEIKETLETRDLSTFIRGFDTKLYVKPSLVQPTQPLHQTQPSQPSLHAGVPTQPIPTMQPLVHPNPVVPTLPTQRRQELFWKTRPLSKSNPFLSGHHYNKFISKNLSPDKFEQSTLV